MQIKNLQVGNSGVAGIDLVAFCEQGFGEIVGPADFSALNLDQRSTKVVRGKLGLALLERIAQIGEAFVDLVFVTGIAA